MRKQPLGTLALLLALLFTLCSPTVVAQGPAKTTDAAPAQSQEHSRGPTQTPFLWRIEGPKTSWLFGTIHVPDPRVLDVADSVDDALDKTDALYTEVILSAEATNKIMKMMRLPRGESLEDLIGAELNAQLVAYLKSKNIRPRTFKRLRPWAAVMTLAMLDEEMLELAKNGHQALDMELASRAKKAGKQQLALEEVEDQIGVFSKLSIEDQKSLLAGTLDSLKEATDSGERPLEKMLNLYLDGDAKALMKAMNDYEDHMDKDLADRLMYSLLDHRNYHMADVIVRRLQEEPGKANFFAAGAAHMPGKAGLVALLRKRGYIVTRMPGARGPKLDAARKAARKSYTSKLQKELEAALK